MTPPTACVATATTTNSYQFGSWIDTTSPAPTPRAPSHAATVGDVAPQLGIAVDRAPVAVDDGRAPGPSAAASASRPDSVVPSQWPARR